MPTNGASHSAGAIAKVNAVQRPFTFGHQSLGAAARKDVRGSCCDRLIPWEDWQMSPLVVRGHHWNSTVRIRRGDNDRGISSSSGVALRQRGYQHNKDPRFHKAANRITKKVGWRCDVTFVVCGASRWGRHSFCIIIIIFLFN